MPSGRTRHAYSASVSGYAASSSRCVKLLRSLLLSPIRDVEPDPPDGIDQLYDFVTGRNGCHPESDSGTFLLCCQTIVAQPGAASCSSWTLVWSRPVKEHGPFSGSRAVLEIVHLVWSTISRAQRTLCCPKSSQTVKAADLLL